MAVKIKSVDRLIFSGKRKTAVAKVKIKSGNGKVFYNFLPQ